MFFVTAAAASAVARRARASEAKAQRVGSDFADLSRLNEIVTVFDQQFAQRHTVVIALSGRILGFHLLVSSKRQTRARSSRSPGKSEGAPITAR